MPLDTMIMKFTCEKCRHSRIVNTGDCIICPPCRHCGGTMRMAQGGASVKLAEALSRLVKKIGIRLF